MSDTAKADRLITKLIRIQQELNAPKSLYNSFGGYAYRSAETILEAVKPLLVGPQLSIKLTDEVVSIGAANYVRAIVVLTDVEGERESAVGYAREQEVKKGMDAAQITGAASSYARKYALNGLFAIDDTKDPDTDESRREKDSAGKISETELAKSRQKLFTTFKTKGIEDSEKMIATIQEAIGKDVVETPEDVAKVIKHLEVTDGNQEIS